MQSALWLDTVFHLWQDIQEVLKILHNFCWMPQKSLSSLQTYQLFIAPLLFLAHQSLAVNIVKVTKKSKTLFFRAIENSFHEVTWICLEPHQIFSFCNISTNMVARGVQSFGRNGPWWAGCLKYGQNFFLKFTQTCDEQMLKISRRYLDSCLI